MRNRAKRRLRALFQTLPKSHHGHYVLVAKSPILETIYTDLEKELSNAYLKVTQEKSPKNNHQKR